MGMPKEQGYGKSDAGVVGIVLHLFGYICPVTRCAKSLLNGPCGGSKSGKCEIKPDRDCAWQLIHDRLKKENKLESSMPFSLLGLVYSLRETEKDDTRGCPVMSALQEILRQGEFAVTAEVGPPKVNREVIEKNVMGSVVCGCE